eukprot:GHUV01031472.1.p1 GENE.GHUV01031472.1~~GHUV01031472.1.p1  ORF type:complete len:114 (+),score=28.03 GHUV01031472.1:933-1274(+)
MQGPLIVFTNAGMTAVHGSDVQQAQDTSAVSMTYFSPAKKCELIRLLRVEVLKGSNRVPGLHNADKAGWCGKMKHAARAFLNVRERVVVAVVERTTKINSVLCNLQLLPSLDQ